MKYMRERGWFIKRMTGNMFQSGVPDLYCYSKQWGERWIDVKRDDGKYSFTDDQKREWPVWEAAGIGIWILIGATQEQYDLLFKPPNMRDYWKPQWTKEFNLDVILAELRAEEDEDQKLIE